MSMNMSTRRVLYVTGTRADFGLMLPTLKAIAEDPALALEICVTGMHLSERYGLTVKEIEMSSLPIAIRIPVAIDDDSPTSMAFANAQVMAGLAQYLQQRRPDILLLLGDRAEMLVAGLSGMLSGIAVAHVCGGERTGSVDDSIRHALSKLAHVHLVATEGSRQRLLRMGEEDWRIHTVGTPGLVGLTTLASLSKADLAQRFDFDLGRPLAAVLFHPVVEDARDAGQQCEALLDAVRAEQLQAICLLPNADRGHSAIRRAIEKCCAHTPDLRAVIHMPRAEYVSLLAVADVLIGNSSSGILEAASFGTPVVNVGDRQRDRERNLNTIDVAEVDTRSIRVAIQTARAHGRYPRTNIYGDGRTDQRITQILRNLLIDTRLFKKPLTY